MTVTITDIATLKNTRADTGTLLRFVTSKVAWYQSNTTSSATGDDDTVVVPAVGAGRWIKQNSTSPASSVNLTWNSISSNTSVSVGNGYFCDTTSAAITLTFPASASIGNVISIYALTGLSPVKNIIINPNGLNLTILGVGTATTNGVINVVNDFVELTYTGATKGWIPTKYSNPSVLKLYQSAYTVANPVSLPNTTGIIDYLGTQKNTLSYQDPISTAGGRTQRIRLYATPGSITISATNSYIFNKNFNDGLTLSDGISTGENQASAPIVLDFLSTGQINPTGIQFTVGATDGSSRGLGFVVYGANNANSFFSSLSLPPSFAANQPYQNGILQMFTDPVQLGIVTGLNSSWTLVSTNYHYLMTISTSNWYRYLIMSQITGTVNGSGGYRFFLDELELFGSVVTA
jgi:hypothetical protein